MTVESAVYINTLNSALPPGTDPKGEGDDHLRLLKAVLKATFPNNSGALSFLYDNTKMVFPLSFRIKADFSNAARNTRTLFQTSVANGGTGIGAIPDGTGPGSNFTAWSTPDPDNAAYLQVQSNAATASVIAGATGTGTQPTLYFNTNGAIRYSIDPSGNHYFTGPASFVNQLSLVGTTSNCAITFSPGGLRYFMGWDGANFTMNRYNGTGTYLNTPFYIRDTDGAFIIGGQATVGGGLTVGQSITMTGTLTNTGNAIELGPVAAGPAYIDFHSGGSAVDYDSRIIATGGNTAAGNGSLDFYAASLNLRATGGYAQLFGASNLCNLRFWAGSYGPFIRSNSGNSAMEWVNSANTAVNLTLTDAGGLNTRGAVTAGAGMLCNGVLQLPSTLWMQGANSIRLDGGGYSGFLRGDSSGLVGFINQAQNQWTLQIRDAGFVKAINGFVWGDDSSTGGQYNGTGSNGAHTENTGTLCIQSAGVNLHFGHPGAGGTQAQFWVTGASVGSISSSTSATSFNTSSDYRLKKNIQDLKGCLDRILQCRPVSFLWRIDEKEARGFIAHELAEVEPDAVYGEKDAMTRSPDGKEIIPNYQGTDTSFVIPDIVGGMQELQQMLEAALARISVLEAK